MRKPWAELTRAERGRINACSMERMRRYRSEGRYGAEWARLHREAVKILEGDFQKNHAPYGEEKECYLCGTEGRPLRTHHIDGNYKNNDINNLAYCCHSCDSKLAWERNQQVT